MIPLGCLFNDKRVEHFLFYCMANWLKFRFDTSGTRITYYDQSTFNDQNIIIK